MISNMICCCSRWLPSKLAWLPSKIRWLPSKLAAWISKNYGQELQIPPKPATGRLPAAGGKQWLGSTARRPRVIPAG